MKFSESWLREWVNPDLTTEQLAHQLTMAGLEVDAIEAVAPEHSGVVVGQILTAQQHPNADKLQVCQVDVGDLSDQPLQIVCGASNARAGLKVACAMVKAKLPGDFKIKKSKLRGEDSYGMLCSAKELGLADSADGIMELLEDAPLGQTLYDYFQLNDVSIELGVTPNRSDCLSIEGVAREVSVITSCSMNVPKMSNVAVKIEDQITVKLDAAEFCPHYVGRIIRGINPAIDTPSWMSEKLRRCGLRSISPIVDITNYVMLELGQPMHAFDLSKLDNGIVVRMAKQDESLELLDGQTIKLNSDTLVIADAKQAVALAGIMGGQQSSVDTETVDILLESAFFVPEKIAGKARSYGLHTDSSHRFERGVSAQLQCRAIERASELIIDIVGGKAGPIVEQTENAYMPTHTSIESRVQFNPARVEKLLGVQLQENQIESILLKLEMKIEKEDGQWLITPPDFRFDIQYDVDLIEEIARIYGYDNLPVSPIGAAVEMVSCPENKLSENRIKETLVALDYQEVINYSFVEPKVQQLIDPKMKKIALTNPISEDLSEMRSTLWPGLIKSLVYNQNRQQSRIRLFETGSRFVYDANDNLQQQPVLSAIATGSVLSEQWASKEQAIDFFDVKADLQAIMSLGADMESYRFVSEKHPALHPGQSARIYKNQQAVGWLGTLHPSVAKQLQIKTQAIVFEVELDAISDALVPKFNLLSKFPAIRRDVAIIVEETIDSSAVINTIKQHAGKNLIEVLLFDVYTGTGVETGKKSLAIGITLQDNDRTLMDDEVDEVISTILTKLNESHNAKLRD
ncbi:MAG: phenylalanine--tRNA ligase subunit beta [Pseudomonadota bacterium]